MIAHDNQKSRRAIWCCAVGLVVVIGSLAVFSILTQRSVAAHSRAADHATRLAAAYADARFWVGQEESLERKYRLEPTPAIRKRHDQAEARVARQLALIGTLDTTLATQRLLAQVGAAHDAYVYDTTRMFRAVDAGDTAQVVEFDHGLVDPVFGRVQDAVYSGNMAAFSRALHESASLRDEEATATHAITAAFALGLLLTLCFGGVLVGLRRRLSLARNRELQTLEGLAMSDPLTGVGNHRAFHEDLDRALRSAGTQDSPLALVMLDVDGLKVVNDTLGHRAGDDHIKAVASALISIMGIEGTVYRVGGDEFAVLCEGLDAAQASDLIEQVRDDLWAADLQVRVSFSAGISEADESRDKDALVREADLALLTAKRSAQAVVVYSAELERATRGKKGRGRLQTGTLANALALAVDAKDSYTRSHCQTVSRLCALVATELGLSPERVVQVRLAGLLHDVGKIGVPDAILNKPGALDDDEYAVMQRHSTLGGEIVAAADMPQESRWIRHHHERFDGTGYPSKLREQEIPLESRIILACDAYEAMTSNRPYRDAPGHAFAIVEIQRNSGTQFDPEVVEALFRALEQRSGRALHLRGTLAEAA